MSTAALVQERIDQTMSSADEVEQLTQQLFGGDCAVHGPPDDRPPARLRGARLGRFSAVDYRVPLGLRFRGEYTGDIVIVSVDGATIDVGHGGPSQRYSQGDVYVALQPGSGYVCDTASVGAQAVVFPAAALGEVSEAMDLDPRGPVFRTTGVTARAAGRWRRVARFVTDLLEDPALGDAPLVTGQLSRLIAATALSVFGEAGEPGAPEPLDGTSRILRRAIAYIESHPDRDVSSRDIADAARTSVRSVQRAFHRELGTTPTAYLRRVRLDLARESLATAELGDGTTVTEVAYRWGFSSPSSFAAYYREAFGELPSRTLQHA